MKNKTVLIGTLLFTILFLAPFSKSATISQWEDEIYLIKGEIASIGVVDPRRVSVANPEVADIETVSNKELILIGKDTGNTILTIWDKLGQRTINVKIVAENLDYLKARVDQLLLDQLGLKEVLTRINPAEGKLVILGRIRPEQEDNFNLLLAPFNDKIINLIKVEEDVLIQIDIQILELSKDYTDFLGVDWNQSISFNEGTTYKSGTGTPPTVTGTGSEIFRLSQWTREVLAAKIELLMSRGKGRVLSRPKLVCLSGKEAEFLVGGQLPIVTSTATSTSVSSGVDYRDYGITLRIQPKVTSDDKIIAKLHTEVSEIDTARGVTTSTVNAPAFSTRSLDTELMLRQGQTIFIAGLIKNKETTTINKFPGLADLPILGALFRSKNFVTGDTELVISLTPEIIRPNKPASEAVEEKAVLPAVSKVEPEDPILKYVNEVQKKISESIYYPPQAKDAGWEGKVNLKLHIKSDGSLSEVDVARSSGYQLFDDTAYAVTKNLSPYPPFPASIQASDLWVEVPVVFQIN